MLEWTAWYALNNNWSFYEELTPNLKLAYRELRWTLLSLVNLACVRYEGAGQVAITVAVGWINIIRESVNYAAHCPSDTSKDHFQEKAMNIAFAPYGYNTIICMLIFCCLCAGHMCIFVTLTCFESERAAVASCVQGACCCFSIRETLIKKNNLYYVVFPRNMYVKSHKQ